MSVQSIQAQLQAATAEYQKVQADLSKIVEASQRLGAQLQENELVKKVSLSMDLKLRQPFDGVHRNLLC
jgi:prefoldin beta subunit